MSMIMSMMSKMKKTLRAHRVYFQIGTDRIVTVFGVKRDRPDLAYVVYGRKTFFASQASVIWNGSTAWRNEVCIPRETKSLTPTCTTWVRGLRHDR